MDEELSNIINYELSSLGFSKIKAETKFIEQLLEIRGKDLRILSDNKLSETLLNISQAEMYAQLLHNVRKVEFNTAKRKYDIQLGKEMTKIKDKKLTIKEKESLVLEDETLLKLEKEREAAEIRSIMHSKIPECLEKIGNSIKYELNLRTSKYKKSG